MWVHMHDIVGGAAKIQGSGTITDRLNEEADLIDSSLHLENWRYEDEIKLLVALKKPFYRKIFVCFV